MGLFDHILNGKKTTDLNSSADSAPLDLGIAPRRFLPPEAILPRAIALPPPVDPAVLPFPDIELVFPLSHLQNHIPAHLVRPGIVLADIAVRYRISELFTQIMRGQVSISLLGISQKTPELFRSAIAPTDDIEIPLSLEMVVGQLPLFPGPNAAPAAPLVEAAPVVSVASLIEAERELPTPEEPLAEAPVLLEPSSPAPVEPVEEVLAVVEPPPPAPLATVEPVEETPVFLEPAPSVPEEPAEGTSPIELSPLDSAEPVEEAPVLESEPFESPAEPAAQSPAPLAEAPPEPEVPVEEPEIPAQEPDPPAPAAQHLAAPPPMIHPLTIEIAPQRLGPEPGLDLPFGALMSSFDQERLHQIFGRREVFDAMAVAQAIRIDGPARAVLLVIDSEEFLNGVVPEDLTVGFALQMRKSFEQAHGAPLEKVRTVTLPHGPNFRSVWARGEVVLAVVHDSFQPSEQLARLAAASVDSLAEHH